METDTLRQSLDSAKNGANGDGVEADHYKERPARESSEAKTRRLLGRMDDRRFTWYHIKAILIAGAGFFTDAYDLFIISIVSPMIGVVYFSEAPYNGTLPRNDDLWIKGMALAGTLIGQVFFGFLGDYLGRKKVYLHTLLLMIFSTVAQAMASNTMKGIGVVAMMAFWRLCLGIGIGGDYPLSASISSEYANKRHRGTMIATVFSMQGFGIMTAAAMACIVLAIFQKGIRADIYELDYVWRLCIGLGAVPAALTIYARAKLPETPRYTLQVTNNLAVGEKNINAIQNEESTFKEDLVADEELLDRIDFRSLNEFITKHPRNFWVLFGTCSTWFFLDIAYYAQNLFLPNILSDLGWAPKLNIHDPAAP